MAYDEFLAHRVRQILAEKNVTQFREIAMMKGLTFMVNEKMCVGVVNDELMARIEPAWHEEAITLDGCRPMERSGKPIQGFVFINPQGIDADDDLDFWIQKALDFNPKAKKSKSKSKG
ncbi:MAG: TfoX/Sxy family protein [Saprospiraceae bacterium]|nr:TfoX/Sxy family protein [Saprospiraceae bacterium]